MPRRAVRAREYEEEDLPQTTLFQRVGWVVLAAVWTFLVVSLASFDSADWPSHTVAVHNEPTRNLCGVAGGLAAYHSYHVIGVGSWVILAGGAGFLAMAAARRELCNPLVRAFGVLLMAVSVSGGHALLAPQVGSLAGAPAGLVGGFIVGEL
ncbi:MAG: DNA translocase FtsK 4TM domain-containing protein, partial [Myxococcota bacterium]